ncbi:MAG: preprotein translocase subunit YajC [Clostridiales bacterium]|nr:preprotein translocase subunit YajC [Clostridiales bacterium]
MDNTWSLISIVVVFGIMYAVLIIPQRRKEKKTKAMLNALGQNDLVMTIGGIAGKIVNINEDDITIETGIDKTKLLVKKWAIRSVEPVQVEESTSM